MVSTFIGNSNRSSDLLSYKLTAKGVLMPFKKRKIDRPTPVCRFCIHYKDAKMGRYDGCDSTDFDQCSCPAFITKKTNHINGNVKVNYSYCKRINGDGQCRDFVGRTEFIWNLEAV